jgi:hypothetical protein
MERFLKLLFFMTMVFSVPLSVASGQEKKNEQKIKVIVADDSGSRTVIDTTFTGEKMPETITLRNGKVIHITKAGPDLSDLDTDSKGKKVIVSVSSDMKDGKETEDKVIIMSSDSVKWTVKPDGDKGSVYVYSRSKSSGEKPEKHIIIASSGDKLSELEGKNRIIISNGKVISHDGGKSFDIVVTDDNGESDSNTARYVFAKDGVVVTIESDDEAIAKELIKEIESRLDAKADTKKTEKK